MLARALIWDPVSTPRMPLLGIEAHYAMMLVPNELREAHACSRCSFAKKIRSGRAVPQLDPAPQGVLPASPSWWVRKTWLRVRGTMQVVSYLSWDPVAARHAS
jgi:hypothetical protein